MSIAYYNEIDLVAAEHLRNLIKAGHIAPGIVDTRSIEDVLPNDLRGFTQCHFFAGVGVWSYALRRAGVPDTARVWTGSCPCQPFSAAGEGNGFADQRHLWPVFHYLISLCGPGIVYGEQVASKDAGPWLDLVHTDMEALGYAFGAVAFPSAGVGAPHIRDRTYWVAHAGNERLHGVDTCLRGREPRQNSVEIDWRSGRFLSARELAEVPYTGNYVDPNRLGHAIGAGLERGIGVPGIPSGACGAVTGQTLERTGLYAGRLDDAYGVPAIHAVPAGRDVHPGASIAGSPGPTNGFWRAADWLGCRDDKWRPVEPGTFPLADGASGRVGRLRAYGNAINAEAAVEFITASGLL